MPKRSPIDQLDSAIGFLLKPARNAAAHPVDVEVTALVSVADLLRDMPDPAFHKQLKLDLERSTHMSAQPVPKPNSMENTSGGTLPTVTPYISVVQAQEVIAFVEQAFGAKGAILGTGSQGGIHADYNIGDAKLMIGGGQAWRNPDPHPVYLHIYVDDADDAYARAIAAGATSLSEPADREYGDREGSVRDIAGNTWWIGQLRNRPRPAGLRDVTLCFEARGAAGFIDFLKDAFAAEEVVRHDDPPGTVRHAQIRVGDTVVEIGEAHGPWQPMPTEVFLTVADCDTIYDQALHAGARSVSAPATVPYGFRAATVSDTYGNTWYINQPLPQVQNTKP